MAYSYNRFILANLARRPTRTMAGVLAIAIGIVMVMLFTGLSDGILHDTVFRTENVKADIIFQPPGSSLLLALNNAHLPMEVGEELRKIDGVRYLTPVLHDFNKARFSLLFGIDPVSFNQVSDGGLVIMSGRLFQGPFECVVDDVFQQSNQVHIGDRLNLVDRTFVITGVFKSGIAARILVPLRTLQGLDDAEQRTSLFYIKCTQPEKVDAVYEHLRQDPRFENFVITRGSDVRKVMSSNLPGLKEFTAVIVFVSVLVCFLVILLTMYTTVKERTREFGILKSLGASRSVIVGLILRESLVMTAAGLVLGLLAALGAIFLLGRAYPSLNIEIPLVWVPRLLGIAVLGGVLGALYPAWSAARQDPVQALMYE